VAGSDVTATDIRHTQVIKDGRSFFVSDESGDVPADNSAALGLYHRDTRFLSRLELTLDGLHPMLLNSSPEKNYHQLVELAYPMKVVDPTGMERRENLSLSRDRVLGDSLFERIRVINYGSKKRTVKIILAFEADFLDIFEVRGLARERRGQMQPPKVERHKVELGYRGLDGATRTTTLQFSPRPTELTEGEARFEKELDPGQEWNLLVEITPQVGGVPSRRMGLEETTGKLEREYERWRKRCTRFKTSNAQLSGFLKRSLYDLKMLLSLDEEGAPFLDAGVPWFSALFGRDSLITAYQTLAVNPDLAWQVLRKLAALQGTKEDEARDEEPGKILHEVRVGEMAGAGEIPHSPYYGSIDSTPLWLMVLASTWAWTADRDALSEVWPNALACLEWIDRYGDRDGDGYVEYEKRAEWGLDNQGWKDSHEAIVHPDGTLARPPIALVEVQAYVYDAKSRIAELARVMDDDALADRLEKEAQDLKDRFNRDFWMEDEGYYALALDGDKQPVRTITSNPGHALWASIADDDKAVKVARRLLAPRAGLSSGWGIRTLARNQRPYDPIGYHTGTVWPHDTALIAHGLRRYRLDREALHVIDQVAAAGAYFPLSRFPELWCGFSAEEVPIPVLYPVACRPQAWASGAPFLMIRSYGGITARAPERVLEIHRPRLPAWLDEVEVTGMRVGAARVDLRFTRNDTVTAVEVPRKEGELEVLIRQ
jgi:glycogen debranching enzyme